MDIRITPAPLHGKIDAIPSKSDAHRLLIASLLSSDTTAIHLPTTSVDIDATTDCIRALGADVSRSGEYISVTGGKRVTNAELDCMESGSTLRFIVPVASAICDTVSFSGRGRLPERPISELLDCLRAHGASFSADKLPFSKGGRLLPGVFEIPGNISSQYITGLLFALPILDGDSEIRLTTKLESSAYIDITLWALERFGIDIIKKEGSFFIKGNQAYQSPKDLTVDGDWSNASYFLASGLMGEGVTVDGLDMNSPQGDKSIIGVFEKLGGRVEIGKSITALPSVLSGCKIDISEIPDMFPTLAVLSTTARGTTSFVGGARLRIKESDRIETTAKLITSLGGNVRIHGDGMDVIGTALRGGEADASGDHRIVMSAALASCVCTEDVIIHGAEAVNKSYPSFFEDFKKLGGKCYVI